ncbi:YbjN domain-containing protein [Nocardia sp. NPDC052112]|uniref:YbjN domain-containing protein n=1 Tax=Nocardia sp. NPDC052112 TaxID=3155646 RepID=UPI003430A677
MGIDQGREPDSGAEQEGIEPKHVMLVPDRDLLIGYLELQGLKYVPLENGGVAVLYEKLDIFFEFVGDGEIERRIVSVRVDYHRRYRSEADTLKVVNQWNLQQRWPRLAVARADDGVSVTGDAHMPVGSGVGLLYFLETLYVWIQGAIAADKYLDSANDGSVNA